MARKHTQTRATRMPHKTGHGKGQFSRGVTSDRQDMNHRNMIGEGGGDQIPFCAHPGNENLPQCAKFGIKPKPSIRYQRGGRTGVNRRFQAGGHTHTVYAHQGPEQCAAPSEPCPEGSYWSGSCCVWGDIMGVTSGGRHYHNTGPQAAPTVGRAYRRGGRFRNRPVRSNPRRRRY